MRLLLYEHLTAGGMPDAPASLLAEGETMVRALASDLQLLPDVELAVFDEQLGSFDAAVERADGVLLIAPETNGILWQLAQRVEALGSRLLSPSSAFVAIASDKQRTAGALQHAGVSVPQGALWQPGDAWPPSLRFPAVSKPRDGCGSQEVRLLRGENELPTHGKWRIEAFVPGLAASVAVLCGPAGNLLALPACSQQLSTEGQFRYLGGATPLAPDLDRRARQLAIRAIEALAIFAPPLGYVGVDLVLGEDAAGGQDAVIEVNPRLTTSYVGLRAACRTNLGAAMLQQALGENVTVEFDTERLEFEASGIVRRAPLSPSART